MAMSVAVLDNIKNGTPNFQISSIAAAVDQVAPDLRVPKLKLQWPLPSRMKSQYHEN